MATKSFLKDIIIKDKKMATNFLNALENAEGKKKKNVQINAKVETVKDSEIIKKIVKGIT